MDVKLKPFDFAQAVARAGLQSPQLAQAARRSAEVEATPQSFRSAMGQALKSASAAQLEASRMQREVQLDNPSVSLEQTMVAMQKAQIGFQSVLQVRNRLLSAYTDVMNMQV
jgi:flagellar hook-basal body complex protein FliE